MKSPLYDYRRNFWNIRPGEVQPGIPIYALNKHPPPLDYEECSSVAGAVDGVLRSYLKQSGQWFNELCVLIYGRSCLFWERGDRTVEFRLEDVRRITPELIRRLQHDVLGRFPWWRIGRVDDDKLDDIVIYPDRIAFGGKPVRGSLENACKRWQQESHDRWEVKHGFLRRQIKWLLSRTPQLVPTLTKAPFVVAGYFDNVRGDFRRRTVWTLQSIRMDVKNSSSYSHIGIDSKGRFDSKTTFENDLLMKSKNPKFELCAWACRKSTTTLVMRGFRPGKKWTRKLNAKSLITDETLRDWEQENVGLVES